MSFISVPQSNLPLHITWSTLPSYLETLHFSALRFSLKDHPMGLHCVQKYQMGNHLAKNIQTIVDKNKSKLRVLQSEAYQHSGNLFRLKSKKIDPSFGDYIAKPKQCLYDDKNNDHKNNGDCIDAILQKHYYICDKLQQCDDFNYGYIDVVDSPLNAVSNHGWLGKLQCTMWGVKTAWGILGKYFALFNWHLEEETMAAISFLYIGC